MRNLKTRIGVRLIWKDKREWKRINEVVRWMMMERRWMRMIQEKKRERGELSLEQIKGKKEADE